ncbi:rCG51711 [Rattus norvegicus]|uniref:RCG51711 n=1 Tax=Rattus norvegicus TaxID=10116 RepID=A6K2U3_RAT|nr:rCG51711 [Rattus norvegicus]
MLNPMSSLSPQSLRKYSLAS